MATQPMFLVAHVLALYVVLGEPWLGVLFYRRLQSRLRVDADARAGYYKLLLGWEWAWVAVIAVILWGLGASPLAVGLATPNELGWVVTAALVCPLVLATALMRFVPLLRANTQQQLARASALLPQSGCERWLYAAVAVTAGICEELLYRGFLSFYLTSLFPGLEVWLVGAVTSLAFGLGHAYQGKIGILQTGVAGAGFLVFYWLSGSIVPSIIAHALSDLRVLALLPKATR